MVSFDIIRGNKEVVDTGDGRFTGGREGTGEGEVLAPGKPRQNITADTTGRRSTSTKDDKN
jgi:hypothetical protein